jgi:hypothetical protein
MVIDPILTSFLDEEEVAAEEFHRASDVVDITPLGPKPRQRYRVEYHCRGLVRTREGVDEANHFVVGIYFPPDYWHRAVPWEVITLLWPQGVWHSNVRYPFICPGRLTPGMGLIDIVTQVYSILTFNNISIREDDSLQPEASSWARRNMHRFPLESRPLRRRQVTFRVKDVSAGAAAEDAAPADSVVEDANAAGPAAEGATRAGSAADGATAAGDDATPAGQPPAGQP